MIRLFVALLCTLPYLCPLALQSQTRIRIRVLDENDQPLKFVRLTLSGAGLPVETQSNGECTIEFMPGRDEILFYPPDNYIRISPPDGRLYVPEDKTRTLTVWMARKSAENNELIALDRILSRKEEEKAILKVENQTLKVRLQQLENERQNTTAAYDSLNNQLKLNLGKTTDLEREIIALEKTVGLKQQYVFGKISGDLDLYIDRLKDVRDALPRVEDAFIDARIMEHLERTIQAYISARDSIVKHKTGNIEFVRALWGPASADQVANIYQSIAGLHKSDIYTLNTTLLQQFVDVKTERVRPAAARKKALQIGNEAYAQLLTEIPSLEAEIKQVFKQLSSTIYKNN